MHVSRRTEIPPCKREAQGHWVRWVAKFGKISTASVLAREIALAISPYGSNFRSHHTASRSLYTSSGPTPGGIS